jgi:hypothetical protein
LATNVDENAVAAVPVTSTAQHPSARTYHEEKRKLNATAAFLATLALLERLPQKAFPSFVKSKVTHARLRNKGTRKRLPSFRGLPSSPSRLPVIAFYLYERTIVVVKLLVLVCGVLLLVSCSSEPSDEQACGALRELLQGSADPFALDSASLALDAALVDAGL